MKFLWSFFICFHLFSAQSFEQWKKSYISRSSKVGIPKSLSKKILSKIAVNLEIIEKEKKQVLFKKKLNFKEFVKKWLRDGQRVSKGKAYLKKYKDLLDKIEDQYQVDREVIISLWGVETLYGEIMGDYNVVEALANLSFASKRSKFYETQLNAAFRLIKKGRVDFESFKGSWAGATGQCQFMPSNIYVYGQDFDKDGKIDLWGSQEDVFASIAYYLKKVGWKKGMSIGSLAWAPQEKINFERYRTYKQYKNLGLKMYFPDEKIKWKRRRASTIPLQDSPIVLRGSNYSSLLKWNRSSLFAAFNIILMNSFSF